MVHTILVHTCYFTLDIFGFNRIPGKNDIWSASVSNKLHFRVYVCACVKLVYICMHVCLCVCTTTYLRIETHDDESLRAYFYEFGMFGIQLLTHYLSKVL